MNSGNIKKFHLKKCLWRDGSLALLYVENDKIYCLQNKEYGAKPASDDWKQYGFKGSYCTYSYKTVKELESLGIKFLNKIKNAKYEIWER